MTFVAVDGGQSEMRLTVVGSGATHRAPGFTYRGGDPVSTIVDAVAAAWSNVPERGQVERVALGLTGLPSTVEQRDRLAVEISRRLNAREVVLCADNVTAHVGALPERYGVVLTVGTGVGCLAVDPASGTARRVDGWGYLFGDGGSAFAIGRAGVAAVLAAHDGRGPGTQLSDRAAERYGPVDLIPQRLYTSPRTVDDTARFAMDVVAAAESGDGVAEAIVRQAGGELARTAGAGVAALPDPPTPAPVAMSASALAPEPVAVPVPPPVPVACTGRLIETSRLLADAFRSALAAACPQAHPVPAAGSALDGACWLATADDPAPYGPQLHIYRDR